jgi:hypothetical protein
MGVALNLLVGVALLTLGRRLFWLFVAGLGFVVSLQLAAHFLPGGATSTPAIVLALVIGIIGAFAARFIQRLAVRLAGFLSGVALALAALQWLQLDIGLWIWAIALAAGLIGALMAVWVFGGALVVLSSAVGAGLIAVNLGLPSSTLTIGVFTAAMLLGIIFQSGILHRFRHVPHYGS